MTLPEPSFPTQPRRLPIRRKIGSVLLAAGLLRILNGINHRPQQSVWHLLLALLVVCPIVVFLTRWAEDLAFWIARRRRLRSRASALPETGDPPHD